MNVKQFILMCFVGSSTLLASPIVDDSTFSFDRSDAIQEVVDAYMELKNALVATDFDAAQKAAMVLKKNAKKAKQDAIAEQAGKIAVAETIKEQRRLFEEVSEQILALCTSEGIEVTVYHQYCPMAFNNEGASWLSYSPEIRNPYFGKMMLKCGMVKEEIK